MEHPLTGKAIYLYILIWSLVISVHALLLHQLYSFDFFVCLTDAGLYYIPLAGFGLSLFYIVRYFRASKGYALNHIIAHLLSAFFVAVGVSYVWRQVMHSIYTDESMQAYINSNFTWHAVSGTLLLILLLMFYYLMENTYRLRERENREKSLESLLRDTEMEMLRFQINPHFIFNSLNSISALTMEDPPKAQEMVIRLSEFFRNALGKNREASHSLREELNQIDLYLQIEKVRFGDRLLLVNEIEEKCLDLLVPALILQPIYENAIKYGLYENLEPVEIKTIITCSEAGVTITVSNPYDSMAQVRKGRGIGLKNVRSRLELMFHIPDLVTIARSKDQFTAELYIPQTTHDQNTAD